MRVQLNKEVKSKFARKMLLFTAIFTPALNHSMQLSFSAIDHARINQTNLNSKPFSLESHRISFHFSKYAGIL